MQIERKMKNSKKENLDSKKVSNYFSRWKHVEYVGQIAQVFVLIGTNYVKIVF